MVTVKNLRSKTYWLIGFGNYYCMVTFDIAKPNINIGTN